MSDRAVTPPKGRATRAQHEAGSRRSFVSPILQWVLVIVAASIVVGVIWYLGRDAKSDLAGSLPVPAAVASVHTL